MYSVDINYWAVLVAALAHMAIGALWYSKLGFGRMWMAAMGKTEEQIHSEGSPGRAMAIAAILALVIAYVLAHTVDFAGAMTAQMALKAGFWTWLGYVFTFGLTTAIFESRSMKVFWIGTSYYLVSLLMMSLILVLWQ